MVNQANYFMGTRPKRGCARVNYSGLHEEGFEALNLVAKANNADLLGAVGHTDEQEDQLDISLEADAN